MSYGAEKGNATDSAVGIYGYYKHKVRSLNVAPTVSIPGGPSLLISSESTYETEKPTPYLSFKSLICYYEAMNYSMASSLF
ncbi:hypothetical protein [Paenibacillus sp. OK060]|uniref:hypothetical protein n=1 Tax=Paenibacillus sp. OK060 TaxID=1881034 RepID=UPI00115F93A9|nr:hypothetical protein [Paenibacillus sp. OK060]